jgi:hypothetical protein
MLTGDNQNNIAGDKQNNIETIQMFAPFRNTKRQ